MTEIDQYQKITLGETEITFLGAFSYSERSASGIARLLEESGMHMSYKNVHRRVKRLAELGLIKKRNC